MEKVNVVFSIWKSRQRELSRPGAVPVQVDAQGHDRALRPSVTPAQVDDEHVRNEPLAHVPIFRVPNESQASLVGVDHFLVDRFHVASRRARALRASPNDQ